MDPLSTHTSVLPVPATIISVKGLQETVQRYQGRDKTLGRLQDSLQDLVTILSSLEAVVNNDSLDLTLLKGPVNRCAQVCREFEVAMKIFDRKSKEGIKDWTKMEFMRGDVDDFIDTLADYKSTISIGLNTITVQESTAYTGNQFKAQLLTQKSLNEAHDNLSEIISRLQESLDSTTSSRALETLRFQEELKRAKACLKICREAPNRNTQIYREVIADEDCDHAVVTTIADLFNVGKVKIGSRSLALLGSLPDDVLGAVSKDRYGSWLSGNTHSNLPAFPKEPAPDTYVNKSFSKDSGYSSMVSKRAPQHNPDDGQESYGCAEGDSESVISVKSLATMNTISSVNPTAAGGAAEEFAEMLLKDNSICGLIKDGYKIFKSDRFERNLRRILKKFAFSLRKEARNDLEVSVVRLVHSYRAFIVIHIKKHLGLPNDRHTTSMHELQKQKQSQLALERFLELLPGVEEITAEDQLEQNEFGSDVDSDFSNDEQPYLPSLEKVKLYLVSSTAYSEFKQQLAEFVRSSCTTNHLSSDKLALADVDLRSDKVADVGEKDLATEESEVFGLISDAKPDVGFPQFGSSSIEDVEVVWNAELGTPQQNEKERLRIFDVEELSKKGLKPQHRLAQNRWSKWRRGPVAKGQSRIEWTCACGHDLFADFNNKSSDTLNKYAAILQRPPNGNAHSTTSQHSTNILTSLAISHLQPNSSGVLMQPPQGLNNLSPISASQTLPEAANGERDLSFLEICVNTGPHLKSLAEIDTTNIPTDGALFQAIRKQYLSLRGFRSRFWLLKPAAISFVRFSLENRHRVGILQRPLALPPKSEVDAKKWVYEPCPLEGDPPIAEDLFLHYLKCSESSGTLLWMLRFPRRLEASLLNSAALATFGWGIHIDEGPDFAALFKANVLVLILSGVAAGLWRFFEHDFQGAFGFACWIVAVLNSLLMAYMFKWKQE